MTSPQTVPPESLSSGLAPPESVSSGLAPPETISSSSLSVEMVSSDSLPLESTSSAVLPVEMKSSSVVSPPPDVTSSGDSPHPATTNASTPAPPLLPSETSITDGIPFTFLTNAQVTITPEKRSKPSRATRHVAAPAKKKQKRMYLPYANTKKKPPTIHSAKVKESTSSAAVAKIDLSESDDVSAMKIIAEADNSDWEQSENNNKKKAAGRKRSNPEDQGAKAEIAAAEAEASHEIDRLLQEANQQYWEQTCGPFMALDLGGTLPVAKKKFGSVQLLQLLTTKTCDICRHRLAMFFSREYMQSRISGKTCPTCYYDEENAWRVRGGNWTPSQAEKAFRLKDLGWFLRQHYPNCGSCSTGMWKACDLYSDETVTEAAIKGYGSVWELHLGLAKYEKRRRK